jgi:hypothetical protein
MLRWPGPGEVNLPHDAETPDKGADENFIKSILLIGMMTWGFLWWRVGAAGVKLVKANTLYPIYQFMAGTYSLISGLRFSSKHRSN